MRRHRIRNSDRINRLAWTCIAAVLFPISVYGQTGALPAPKASVNAIYTSFTASHANLWLAADKGLYDKYGLEVKLINGRSAIPVQALVSDSVEFGILGGSYLISANLSGADLVAVASKPGFLVGSIWTRDNSRLKTVGDLKGKSIGVSSPGSTTHYVARIALGKFGIAENDVKFIHHGTLRDTFASLERGLVDAAVGSSPPKSGFLELANLSKEKFPFLLGCIVVQRRFLQHHRPVVVNFLKAYTESLRLAKLHPEWAVASTAKHLQVSYDAALAMYRTHENVWEEIPYVRADSIQSILDYSPREMVRNARAEDFMDNGILKELHESGFVKNLYR